MTPDRFDAIVAEVAADLDGEPDLHTALRAAERVARRHDVDDPWTIAEIADAAMASAMLVGGVAALLWLPTLGGVL